MTATRATPTAATREVRLEDYRPPPFLVDRIDLDFDLSAAESLVTSTLLLQRAPDTAPDAPLVLDGTELELVDVAFEGRVLSRTSTASTRTADSSCPRPSSPGSGAAQARPTLTPRSRCAYGPASSRNATPATRASTPPTASSAPSARRRTSGASPSIRTVRTCSPASPRPCARGEATSRCCSRTATRSRAARRRTAGTGCAGKIPSPSPPTCSRSSRATLPASRACIPPGRAATLRCASTPRPTTSGAAGTRWPRSRRRCAGTRRSTGSSTTSISS